jgi:hypothetical protein
MKLFIYLSALQVGSLTMAIPPGSTIVFIPTRFNPIPNVDGTIRTRNNTAIIDSGPIAGEVFDGRGNSFLDPNDILATINNFGKSIGGNKDDLLKGELNAIDIMRQTQRATNNIFSRNFIPPAIQLPLLNLPLALPVPDINRNSSANQINLASLFMTNTILAAVGTGPPIQVGGRNNNQILIPTPQNGNVNPVNGVSNGNLSQQLLQMTSLFPGILPNTIL